MTSEPEREAAPNKGVPSSGALGIGEAERRSLPGRAWIVSAGTLLSRVLGLGRDLVLAAVFPRAATDAFFVAFTIPNVLRQLLAEGAVQNAVLPVLTQTRQSQGEVSARQLFQALRGLSLLVLAVVSVLGVVFASGLVQLFAAGFHDHPGQFERTVTLTRWVFPYIFFMGTFALGMAALNMHKRFVVTSFAPGLLNVAFIACVLSLTGWFSARGEDPLLAIAVGALLGGALQVLSQWHSLRLIGYLHLPKLSLGHPGVREVLRRMGPTLFGIGIYYIDVVLARRFLSELGIGAQSYFGWALRLCDFPQGIFVMALQTAALPSLALLAAKRDLYELKRTFAFSMRLTLFVGIGASVLLVALSEPLVVLLFQRGAFDATSARETARALVAQGLGVWAVAAVRQLVAVYFALGDTRTPVIVSALDLGVFIVSALLLRDVLGHVGISLAVAIASMAQMSLLWFWLHKRLESLPHTEILRAAARALALALTAGVGAVFAARLSFDMFHQTLVSKIGPGLLGATTFAVLFIAGAALSKNPEWLAVVEPVRRKLRRG